MAYITGTGGNDRLTGTVSADNILGFDGNDTLVGGAGNDNLYGDAGNDTYLFTVGDGVDHINDNDLTVGNLDVASFTGVASTAVTALERQGNALVLKYGTSDQVIVDNYFSTSFPGYKIEQFKFSDGVTWDEAGIKARVITMGTTAAAFEVDWLCSLSIALISATGPAPTPIEGRIGSIRIHGVAISATGAIVTRLRKSVSSDSE